MDQQHPGTRAHKENTYLKTCESASVLAIEQEPRLEAFQSIVYRIGARQPHDGMGTNRQGHTLPTPVDPKHEQDHG